MVKTAISALIAASVVAGCATSPNKISAAYVSPTKYRSHSCEDIDRELGAVDARAVELHRKLRKRADTDAFEMTAGLLLVWPMLLFLSGGDGPEATEYAQLKGERDALLLARPKCSSFAATSTSSPEVPGTQIINTTLRLVPAATVSGYCIKAPANYRGTGSKSRPAITDAMPRCD